jgi:hypothetical protein
MAMPPTVPLTAVTLTMPATPAKGGAFLGGDQPAGMMITRRPPGAQVVKPLV